MSCATVATCLRITECLHVTYKGTTVLEGLNNPGPALHEELFGCGWKVQTVCPLRTKNFIQCKNIVNSIDLWIMMWPMTDKVHIKVYPGGATCKILLQNIVLHVCKLAWTPKISSIHWTSAAEPTFVTMMCVQQVIHRYWVST